MNDLAKDPFDPFATDKERQENATEVLLKLRQRSLLSVLGLLVAFLALGILVLLIYGLSKVL